MSQEPSAADWQVEVLRHASVIAERLTICQQRHAALLAALDALPLYTFGELLDRQASPDERSYVDADELAAELAKHREGR
jgi:hypothetical protein